MGYFSFGQAQNVGDEILFSIPNCFLGDRPNNLPKTMVKMMFVQFNLSIQIVAETFFFHREQEYFAR